jgi:cytochrome c oxidase subunit I+III
MLSEHLGRWAFWLMFVGFNAAFLPMHLTGLRGMPRRVYTYSGDLGWNTLNLVTTVFSFVFAAGLVVIAIDFARHLRGPIADKNPWNAPSLEWMSALAGHGFRSLVTVESLYPLWDQPGLKQKEVEGLGFLPDAPVGERETLITSVTASAPRQILRLPGPGWTAFIAALSSAIAVGAMTVKSATVGWLAGAVAIGSYFYWLWSVDKALPRELADAGGGVALPLYDNSGSSVGRWALAVLLVCDAAVIASFGFAYLYLWTARPSAWPPDGSQIPTFGAPVIIALAVVLGYALFVASDRFNQRSRRGPTVGLLLLAAALASVAIVVGVQWIRHLGIDPTRHAYGAAVWTLLGYMALHIGVGALMAIWCAARVTLKMIDPWRCMTLRISLVWWRFTALATLLVILLIAAFPHVS